MAFIALRLSCFALASAAARKTTPPTIAVAPSDED
jgi:hypothetical protein